MERLPSGKGQGLLQNMETNSQTSNYSSPVTDLTRNLGGLSTGSRGTPRRRISWSSNEDTPEGLRIVRKPLLGGNLVASPQFDHLEDSPMFQDRLLRDVSVADNCLNTYSSSRLIRRVKTLPVSSRPLLQEAFEKENIPRGSQEPEITPVLEESSLSVSNDLKASSVPTSCDKTGKAAFSSFSDSDSHDDGYAFLLDKEVSEKSFMTPLIPPPKRTTSPLKSIANQQLTRLNSADSAFGGSSCGFRNSERSSVSITGTDDDIDDGFLDILEMDTLDSDGHSSVNDCSLPKDFYRLLSNPLSASTNNEDDSEKHFLGTFFSSAESPKRHPIRRCLSMIEESPVTRRYTSPKDKLLKSIDQNNNFGSLVRKPEDSRKRLLQDEDDRTFKKPCDPPNLLGNNSAKHVQEMKRRKGVSFLTKSPSDSLVLPSPRILLQRSHSETEAITKALVRSTHNPNLIGDCSSTYALPLVKGRHDDLKAITCSTLSNLLQGVYQDIVEEFEIVDCRYPYEYEGGHINGASNLYTKESILEKLINQQPSRSTSIGRKILVFHCEFSSERGPNLCRFLRNKDREANKDNYPNLFHPEIYLLEGGYRDFYNHYKELCTPQSYLPMLSKDHEKDLRKFRSKSKSWSGDTKSRIIAVRPGLKL